MAVTGGAAVLDHVRNEPPVSPSVTRERPAFRSDIQGLRAVAVLLVLAFHAGVPAVAGGYVGVDVFFVISGFLITGLIVREVESTGRLNLRRFWARRARRLLPAAAVVLGAVAAIAFAVLPFTRWPSIAADIVASATYVVNWRLAAESVDYLAAESAPSPVQHFWSLAVEEQFYIVWPLAVVALLLVTRSRSRRGKRSVRRVLLAGILIIGAPSLIWSISQTAAQPEQAYFVSTTRAWELALGAGLAIVAPRLAHLRRPAAEILAWGGLAAIAWSALTYTQATPFPGAAALAPTLGTAAVLAAGIGSERHTAARLLSLAPMRDVGALSYSLYLWHWPVLVAAAAVWGRDDGSLWLPVAVMAAGFSAIPAWFTYRVVEEPIHRGRFFATSTWRAAGLGVACTATGIAAAVAISAAVPAVTYPSEAEAPGAAALLDDPDAAVPDGSAGIQLDPVAASEDSADVYADGCHQRHSGDELVSCTYGDEDAEFVVALAGDSHAAQWQPALARIASSRGWRLETYTKSDCNFVDVPLRRGDKEYGACSQWNDELLERLTGPQRPDMLVTSGSNKRIALGADEERDDENQRLLADGMRGAWSAVEEAGVDVVVIRDTPWRPFEVPECVAENLDRLEECSTSAEVDLTRYGRADVSAAEASDEISWVDMTAYICPEDECPSVIGNVVVWQDRHHLTGRYAESLAPILDDRLVEAIEG